VFKLTFRYRIGRVKGEGLWANGAGVGHIDAAQ
jgi:hypothetical protein